MEAPEYGVLRPYYKSWGIIDSNDVDFSPITSDYCTREELGLKPDVDEF